MKPNRMYKGKNVDMLMTVSTIVEHAIENQATLIAKRPDWASPYFPNLQTRIDTAFTDILGVSSVETQKAATREVVRIQKQSLTDLADFKVQLDVACQVDKSKLKVLNDTLGFSQWYKKAQSKNQEALINLLFLFKNNLSEELKTELTSKGIQLTLMEGIASNAAPMKAANIAQEQSKGNKKEISQAAQDELNAIYTVVIGMAKITSRFFADNKAKKELFSYAKVLSQISTSSSKGGDDETPAE